MAVLEPLYLSCSRYILLIVHSRCQDHCIQHKIFSTSFSASPWILHHPRLTLDSTRLWNPAPGQPPGQYFGLFPIHPRPHCCWRAGYSAAFLSKDVISGDIGRLLVPGSQPPTPGATCPPALPMSLESLPGHFYIEAALQIIASYPFERTIPVYTLRKRVKRTLTPTSEWQEKSRQVLTAYLGR
ncbi:hypothetical protein B0H19DRAFT_1264063 [Mycena capillaripes]|nr:hypothetical protein B0H19DRAFT_1264063 [Mycena capillaripes]